MIEVWSPYSKTWIVQEDRSGYGWGEVSYVKGLMDENNVSKYRLHVVGSDGEEAYSNEFTVQWTKNKPDIVFTTQPTSGTAKKNEGYTYLWALSETPDSIFIQAFFDDNWHDGSSLMDKTSDTVSYKPDISKYRIKATKGSETVYSNEFTATWTEDSGESLEKPNPFEDIYESDEYYNAVLWAYYAAPQITNGMDETHFGPNFTVTRAQAVTFLWRSQGCPEPSSTVNPFVDVPTGEWYYKSVLWAVESNITKGTTETTFAPSDTLTTQHMITFLYRTVFLGKDGWNGEAAAWAGQGYGGKPFGVDIVVNNTTPCPRCRVVQFLYTKRK